MKTNVKKEGFLTYLRRYSELITSYMLFANIYIVSNVNERLNN